MVHLEIEIISKPGALQNLLHLRESRLFLPERSHYDYFLPHIWQPFLHLCGSPYELLGVLSTEVLDWVFCPIVTEFSVFPCAPLVPKQTIESEITQKAMVFS